MKRQEWERDLINRQRNIVFPDTVLNEGRFYRNIFSRDAEFTPSQRLGLIFFGLCVMVPGCIGLAVQIAALLRSPNGTEAFEIVPACFMSGVVILGVTLLIRGLFPPKLTRLARLRRYRRPPNR